ncbi:MAG: hypothetical protein HUU20_29225 [Pirellulales bacterium]|nr:hypothetical protein [Pirellulales bacterium]
MLQKPLRQARILHRHNQYVRRLYRIHRKDLDRRLRAVGLRLQGHEVRGWRLVNAACGGSIQSLQSSIAARPVPLADFLHQTRENWKIVTSSAKPSGVETPTNTQTSAA